jgi:hypothetical protein
VLAALEAHNGSPEVGRSFIDPVLATTVAGEVVFLNSLINQLSTAIYGDEFAGALSTPSGSRAFSMVQHAIDSKEGDLPGAYQQAYSGDYFNGKGSLDAFACYQARTTKGTPVRAGRERDVDRPARSPRRRHRQAEAVRAGGIGGAGAVDAATHYGLPAEPQRWRSHVPGGIVTADWFVALARHRQARPRLRAERQDARRARDQPAGGQDHPATCEGDPEHAGPAANTQVTVADQFQSRTHDVKQPVRSPRGGAGGAGITSFTRTSFATARGALRAIAARQGRGPHQHGERTARAGSTRSARARSACRQPSTARRRRAGR